jgi:hypothetical protein
VKIGALSCEVSGGLGLIIASSKDKFGLDIGATNKGVLAWDVFAPILRT